MYVILVVLGRVGGAGIWWFSLGVFFFYCFGVDHNIWNA